MRTSIQLVLPPKKRTAGSPPCSVHLPSFSKGGLVDFQVLNQPNMLGFLVGGWVVRGTWEVHLKSSPGLFDSSCDRTNCLEKFAFEKHVRAAPSFKEG